MEKLEPIYLEKEDVYKQRPQKPVPVLQEYKEFDGIQYKVIVLDYRDFKQLKVCCFSKPYNVFLLQPLDYQQISFDPFSKSDLFDIAFKIV